MSKGCFQMVDGNKAATLVAHACNEVMAIYPITPLPQWENSPMNGRHTDFALDKLSKIAITEPKARESDSRAGRR